MMVMLYLFSISNCVYAGVKYHLVYVVYHLLPTWKHPWPLPWLPVSPSTWKPSGNPLGPPGTPTSPHPTPYTHSTLNPLLGPLEPSGNHSHLIISNTFTYLHSPTPYINMFCETYSLTHITSSFCSFPFRRPLPALTWYSANTIFCAPASSNDL